MDNLLQEITIYHKNDNNEWVRFNLDKVSVRGTSILNRNNTGTSNVDNAIVRIFDIDRYNNSYFVSKGDIIVNSNVKDNIVSAPLTELQKKYGKENCYQVKSIDVFKFDDEDTKDIQHVKIGAI